MEAWQTACLTMEAEFPSTGASAALFRPGNTTFRSNQCWDTWGAAQRGLVRLLRLEVRAFVKTKHARAFDTTRTHARCLA